MESTKFTEYCSNMSFHSGLVLVKIYSIDTTFYSCRTLFFSLLANSFEEQLTVEKEHLSRMYDCLLQLLYSLVYYYLVLSC